MRAIGSVVLFLAWSAAAWAQVPPAPQAPGGSVRIDITGQGDPRTPVAVPYFAAGPGAETVAKELAEVVAFDLEFTGLFKILPVGQFPAGFAGFSADPTQIDFAGWQKTPAEYLVHGYVVNEGGSVTGQFRLFDVATGSQVLGKQLAGQASVKRTIGHQFSDMVTQQITGTPGCATSRIFFSSGSTGKKEIYVADYDGANPRQLTKHGSVSILPVVSPDGSRIAYTSFKERYPWLYILDVATGAVKPLSRRAGANIGPEWAPDGNSLALTLSKDGNQEIYRINADGSGERRLTNGKPIDTSPAFSPDGRQIAFVSDRGGQPQIWVMGSDGSNPHRLSRVYGKCFDPVWSPDGTRIAFVLQGGGINICVMNADGSNVRTLTNGGTNEQPTWSPDSRHIMFHRTQGTQLRVVDVDTSNPRDRQLPFLKMPAQGPSWGPRQ